MCLRSIKISQNFKPVNPQKLDLPVKLPRNEHRTPLPYRLVALFGVPVTPVCYWKHMVPKISQVNFCIEEFFFTYGNYWHWDRQKFTLPTQLLKKGRRTDPFVQPRTLHCVQFCVFLGSRQHFYLKLKIIFSKIHC